MSEPIVSIEAIQRRAQRAVESGQTVHQFQAWPAGTAAGLLFLREVSHLQAVREASQRVQGGVHG